jgi:hypothetical protein
MSLDELSVQARLRQGELEMRPLLASVFIERLNLLGAGYGLYATRSIPSDTPLFTIPASALPNVLTLGSHYPGSDHALTAVQLISLHLALHQSSSDPIFGPYISVLPRDFVFHPLTWLRKRNHGVLSRDCEERLLDALPLSVMKKLKDASAKFETDWKRVEDYLVCLHYSTASVLGNTHSSKITPVYTTAFVEIPWTTLSKRRGSCGLG